MSIAGWFEYRTATGVARDLRARAAAVRDGSIKRPAEPEKAAE